MTTNSDLQAIARYLNKNHVVTLCTVSDADLWCASCFYLFDELSMSLIIMSETHTRHGAMGLANPFVAGTIAAQTKNVALIQGIQYKGRLSLLSGESESNARERYIQRFPVAKLANVPLWQLNLDEIKMTDNKLGFGKKRLWVRNESQC